MSAEPLVLRAPPSKSQTQRALLLAALAPGESELVATADCTDSRVLREALGALGVEIRAHGNGNWLVRGGELHPPAAPLWCGEAGTVVRFLAPLALLFDGELPLEGSPRLQERPLGPLLAALEPLGITTRELGRPRCLPLALHRSASRAGRTTIDASSSSQFVSALLMVAPCLPQGLLLELQGEHCVSLPYVKLTRQVMASFGTEVRETAQGYLVEPQRYRPCRFVVEGDWSGAAFLLAGAWLQRRQLVLENLATDSLQGDRQIVTFLAQLAEGRAQCFDLTDCPDLIAPLAAAAVGAAQPVTLAGVAHARLKESDRVAVLAAELRRAGVQVDERPDGLTIVPPVRGQLRAVELDPCGDHRMAMAFALLSLLEPGLRVRDPGCVSKSYPLFWEDLERLRVEHG